MAKTTMNIDNCKLRDSAQNEIGRLASVDDTRIHALVDVINDVIFDDKLPAVVVKVSTSATTAKTGLMAKASWNDGKGGEVLFELLVNAGVVGAAISETLINDLIHECLHVYDLAIAAGSDGVSVLTSRRGQYHNSDWSAVAARFGLTSVGPKGQGIVKASEHQMALIKAKLEQADVEKFNLVGAPLSKEIGKAERMRTIRFTCPACGLTVSLPVDGKFVNGPEDVVLYCGRHQQPVKLVLKTSKRKEK